MNNYTKEDIMKLVEEEDVEFIRLQFTDIFGSLKNMAVTASQLEKALEGRFMFDGSAIEGFASIEDSDLYLKPTRIRWRFFHGGPSRQGGAPDLRYRPSGRDAL